MKKLAISVFAVGAALAGISAHAAPTSPSGPAPTPTFRPGPIKGLGVDVQVLPTTTKCGERSLAQVKLTNRTLRPWTGRIVYTDPTAQLTNAEVSLGATGEEATKTVQVSGHGKVDCKARVEGGAVRVLAASGQLLEGRLLGASFNAERGFPAPPQTETKVWLRRVALKGSCHGATTATATLHSFGGGAQNAQIKLTMGSATKETMVSVPANTPTAVTLDIPQLDCSQGIPTLSYALASGLAASGSLDVMEVVFVPTGG